MGCRIVRNAENAAFPIAFVWVILIPQGKEGSIVFGDVGSEGPLGLEDGVAELGFDDGLRIRGKGDVKFDAGTSDRVDENFAGVWGGCIGAEVEEGEITTTVFSICISRGPTTYPSVFRTLLLQSVWPVTLRLSAGTREAGAAFTSSAHSNCQSK